MKKQTMIKIFVFMFLLVLLMQTVTALGVSPARKRFDLSELPSSGEIEISNSQNKDMSIIIYATGEYANHIKFEKEIVMFSSSESKKTVKYTLTPPENINPGRQDIVINIKETSAGLDSDMTSMTTVLAHAYIDVPYPGKYVEGKLNIDSANTGETTTFAVSVFNKGNERINEISGTIIIKGPTNEEIERINLNSISLEPEKSSKVVGQWNTDVNPGLYYAEAVVNFDGKQLILRETFTVGQKSLKIRDLLISSFKLGQIAKVDVTADSIWNQEIKNIYAEMDVIDSTGLSLVNVKTASVDISPLGTETLSGYWDTKGMSIGNYDISVKLFYDGTISEKLFEAVINANNIQITDTSKIAGHVISAEKGETSVVTLLIIAVIILIVMNVGWLLYLKKSKEKKALRNNLKNKSNNNFGNNNSDNNYQNNDFNNNENK